MIEVLLLMLGCVALGYTIMKKQEITYLEEANENNSYSSQNTQASETTRNLIDLLKGEISYLEDRIVNINLEIKNLREENISLKNDVTLFENQLKNAI